MAATADHVATDDVRSGPGGAPRRKPVNVFVSGRGNEFMTDIASWLVEAADQLGRTTALVTDGLPHDPDAINVVVAPHEMYVLAGATDAEVNRAAAISIPVGTEQPGTPWFEIALSYLRPSPLVLDINAQGVRALRHANVPAQRLVLGGVSGMVAAPPAERDLDVLFLGGDTPWRRTMLAPLGRVLADRRAELRLFSFAVPVHTGTPGLVFGAEKYALLSRTRLLVNVHRDARATGYFEWARMVEAMANGCVVVTEPSAGAAPLEAGVHFVETDDLAGAVEALLDDPEGREQIASAARVAVLDHHPLAASLGPILDQLDTVDVGAHVARHGRSIRRNRIRHAHTSPVLTVFRPATAMRARTYSALLAEMRLRRDVDAARCRIRFGAAEHVAETTTPAYADATPGVSVIVTLHDYAGLVVETLESIVASRDVAFEIVVIDDHSTDDGRAVVQRFLDGHADVPMLLLGCDANRGLAAARNLGVARSRCDRIMVMDADNLVYPACLRRLSDALDAHPDAAFAYATLEAFGVDPGLRSQLGWNPAWLCAANYIDAQAMVRRTTFERHDGYRDDDEWVYGYEDWDLWLRLAAAGEHGTHVPQMLGRYRTQASSMITITNLAADVMRERVEQRYPTLPWPTR